jgi:diguanylate cyclase (GGDEF)-like protein
MKILLVEDDEILIGPLMKALTAQHYVVEVATDGQMAWELADQYPYDLIVLDVELPNRDGISICRQLRSQGNLTPILLLTAKDTTTTKVSGLDAGADDYVTKPFALPELLARIRALLRRGGESAAPSLKWQDLNLDPNQCKVTYRNQVIHLTPKEYGLLQLFMHQPHRIFSCSSLIDHLWSFEEPPSDDTVRSHLKGLRQKLKLAGVLDDPIETVYGIGYRLKPEPKESTVESPVVDSAAIIPGVQTIWQQVKETLLERVAQIQQAAIAAQEGNLTDALKDQAEKAAHKLAGSLGMFGSDHGSQIAQQLEQLFALKTRLRSSQIKKLAQLAQALQQALQQMESQASLVEEAASEPLSKVEARVLVVDDDETILASLQKLLAPWGLQVIVLNEPTRYLNIFEATSPDIVILDEEMPTLSGTDLCRMTRNLPQGQDLPILFLTAHNDAETIDRIFSAGATDFALKPLIAPELIIRVIHRLEQARLLRHCSNVDSLTGVANRHQSSQALTKLLQHHHSDPPSTIYFAVVAVQHLNQINLEWGHEIGDQILRQLGQLLQTILPTSAIIGRWGGAEFIVASSDLNLNVFTQIAKTLEQQSFTSTTGTLGTLSGVKCLVGLAQFPQDGQDLQTLYQAAIQKLTGDFLNCVYTHP